jgi:hypothetical protein
MLKDRMQKVAYGLQHYLLRRNTKNIFPDNSSPAIVPLCQFSLQGAHHAFHIGGVTVCV